MRAPCGSRTGAVRGSRGGRAGLVRGIRDLGRMHIVAVLALDGGSAFEQQGGVLKKARVVDDGDLVTAGGVTSGLDLALWLVRRELGVDAALGLEAMLEYEARGTVWSG